MMQYRSFTNKNGGVQLLGQVSTTCLIVELWNCMLASCGPRRNRTILVLSAMDHDDAIDEETSKKKKKKGNAIPVSGCGSPYGCEKLRLPHFLEN
jgi:hypothetical protein